MTGSWVQKKTYLGIVERLQERTMFHPQVMVPKAIKYFVAHSMLMELSLSLVAQTLLQGYI